jgi:hypothetical protein
MPHAKINAVRYTDALLGEVFRVDTLALIGFCFKSERLELEPAISKMRFEGSYGRITYAVAVGDSLVHRPILMNDRVRLDLDERAGVDQAGDLYHRCGRPN